MRVNHPQACMWQGVAKAALQQFLIHISVQVLVAGKLAKALKPHQWAGVRFMWKNVVDGQVCSKWRVTT